MKLLRVAAIVLMAIPTAAAVQSVAGAGDVQPLIVGGEPADQVYPWMGSIQPQGYSHYCGASLIKPQWMVTAAHCVDGVNPSTTKIRIGSNDRTSGGELAQAAQFIKHPNYSTQYDIAVIKLASPSSKTPIAIGSTSPAPNTAVRLLGWGQTCAPRGCGGSPVGLKQLDTRILADSNCQGLNSNNELCVYGTTTNTACYGDSGGPALVGSGTSWALVGATSRSGDNNTTCGTGNAIYEDVVAFKSWIDSVTGDTTPPPPTGCSGYAQTYTGTLPGTGASQIHPNGSYFYTGKSGQHRVCLDGPNGTDFDLYLQKWNGYGWATVAKSDSPNPDEQITYSGTAGYYRYRVVSYSGSGSYTLGADRP